MLACWSLTWNQELEMHYLKVIFFCFHRDRDDGRTSREFTFEDAELLKYQAKLPYQVTLYTGDKPQAGTGALCFRGSCLYKLALKIIFSNYCNYIDFSLALGEGSTVFNTVVPLLKLPTDPDVTSRAEVKGPLPVRSRPDPWYLRNTMQSTVYATVDSNIKTVASFVLSSKSGRAVILVCLIVFYTLHAV